MLIDNHFQQHFALVGTFTRYLELLLIRAPDSMAKQWIAKVLVNEYGEGSDNQDHAQLYQGFLACCGNPRGQEFETPLHPAVTGFIQEQCTGVKCAANRGCAASQAWTCFP